MNLVLSAGLVCFLVVAPLTAQTVTTASGAAARWQLPPHGVVRYSATESMTSIEADGRRFNDIGMSTEMVPMLFADELDGARMRGEPWSLPSLAIWLAADLSSWDRPGPVRRAWSRIVPVGAVTFDGTAGRVIDGWQELRGRVSRRAAPERRDEDYTRVERGYLDERLDGTLVVRRRFDAAQGVLTEVVWTLDAKSSRRVDETTQRPITLQAEVHWQLRDVVANRDAARGEAPGFAAAVQQSSEHWVAQQLAILAAGKDRFVFGPGLRGNVQGPALHALMLYGLGRAGQRAGTPAIDAAVDALLRRGQEHPLGAALAIQALAELCAPAAERAAVLRGEAPIERALPPSWRRGMTQLLQQLRAQARHGTGNETDSTWWPFAADCDSWSGQHTWQAVLAFDAAARCGERVEADEFARMARHLLAAAMPDGPAAPLALRREQDGAESPAPIVVPQRLGWSNQASGGPGHADGAETAGAMAALLACRRNVRDAALQERIDVAVRGGWAWLAEHWTPRAAPCELSVLRQHHAEFVLAMARLFDESQVRWLGERDLYFELASLLLHRQVNDVAPSSSVVGPPAALALWRPFHPVVTQSGAPARDR